MLQVNKLTLKSVFTPLFLLIFSAAFLSTFIEQIVTRQVEQLISSKDGLSSILWVYVGISLMSSILFPIFMGMLASFNILRDSFKSQNSANTFSDFFVEHLEQNLIESFRAWGKGFLWCFVFILPGIWKFISFIFTPYVVMFSERYRRGEVDALEYSAQICKKYFKRVNWWLTVFYFILPIILYVIAEPYRLLNRTPFVASILVFIDAISKYAFHYFMLKIFFDFINEEENKTENNNEAAIQQQLLNVNSTKKVTTE